MTTTEWTIYVCSLCGSDDIMSNEDSSYCNACKEWMDAESRQVVAKTDESGRTDG